jgi:WD40 repeat protein
MRHGNLVRMGVALLLIAAWRVGGQEGPPRLQVPAQADLDKSLSRLRKAYADDYAKAAQSVPARRAFAETLRVEAASAKESPALYYATLKEAADIAVQAGDTELAYRTLDEIGGAFKVDPVELRISAVVAASKLALETDIVERIGEAALALLDQAIDSDAFAAGDRLAAAAQACAERAKNTGLSAKAQRSAVQLAALKKEFETVKLSLDKLKSNPSDPDANLAVGKFLCLGKGSWDKGLSNLVLGSDATLKALAQRDKANPEKTADRLALGDSWWELAEKEEDPGQRNLQRRAVYWYSLAYADLTGINKTKVDKRLQAAGQDQPAPKITVGLIKTFEGHTRSALSAAMSRDGKLIVSAGADDDLRLWDAATANEIKVLKGHNSAVWSVAFTPDGKSILSGGEDTTVRLWDVDGEKQLRQFDGHTDIVNRVTISSDGKYGASAGDDKLVFVWDLASGKEYKKLEGHTKAVWGAAFSKDGTRLVTGGIDKVAIVWDVHNGVPLRKFEGHTEPIATVAIAPDGKHAISAGSDMVIRLWEVDSGKEIRRMQGHTAGICSVAYSPDGRRILSASRDKTVRLWDATTSKLLHTFEGHTDEVNSVVFSDNGWYAVSASVDQTLRLWGLPK